MRHALRDFRGVLQPGFTCLLLVLLAGLPGRAVADTFTTLYSFSATSSNYPYTNADGAYPYAPLIQASDGNFYGTTYYGGADGWGTIFKITPSGELSTLYTFTGGTDGSLPTASLIQASDGNLYGTTTDGVNTWGSIFKITPTGTFTTLYSFSYHTDGAEPLAGLIQASDGNLYGTTYTGGANHNGTIFKITLSGALTTLYSFSATSSPPYINTDGASPRAGLIQASDGNFYGTCYSGGTSGSGTIFKITPSGAFTTLHSFSAFNSSGVNTDGNDPEAGLIQASDGNLYGTAYYGGAYGDGTIFRISTTGTFTTLYSFTGGASGF